MPYLDSPQNTTNPFVFHFRQPSMKMQDLMLKFPHLPEQIFQKLNLENLFKCREVAKSWQEVIDEKNYPWLRIVNIPTILLLGNTYLHLAAETGQIEAFKIAFSEEKDKNITNEYGKTSLHRACTRGRINIVQLLLLKNNDLKININAEDNHGATAFHWACFYGQTDVVKIFMENAAIYGIDLSAKDDIGCTAFHYAFARNLDVFQLFMENAAALSIDLNSQSEYGWTAFHIACRAGRTDVVKCFTENAAALSIDLNIKDLKGKTAFHMACEKSHLDIVEIFLENAAALNIDLNVKSLWKILSLHPNVYEKPGACFPLNFGS